jgi:hypothetical protein
MAGKSPVVATDDQKAALKAMAGGADRAEADRARAIRLTLGGWTSARIAEAFGVREDTVRLWRSEFMIGGIDALAGEYCARSRAAAFRWRRPRHMLKGRQDADAVDWGGLRLKLRKAQAASAASSSSWPTILRWISRIMRPSRVRRSPICRLNRLNCLAWP